MGIYFVYRFVMLSVLACRDSARRSIRPRPRIAQSRLAVGHLAAQPLACCRGTDAVRRRGIRLDQPELDDVLNHLDTAFLRASNQAPRDRRMSASPVAEQQWPAEMLTLHAPDSLQVIRASIGSQHRRHRHRHRRGLDN